MKDKNSKGAIWFTIIFNSFILLGIITFFIYTFLTGIFSNKINVNDFLEKTKNNGCILINMNSGDEEYEGTDTYLKSDKNTCNYEIEYITFTDDDTLEDYFDSYSYDVLYENKDTKSTYRTDLSLLDEYYEYKTIGKYYKFLVFNNGDFLYINADKKYENELDTMLGSLESSNQFDNAFNFTSFICLITTMSFIICLFGTFKKTRNKGWIAFIPFYNICTLIKDVFGSYLYSLLLLIPLGNIVFMYILLYKLGKAFDKSDSYSVLLMLFPTVIWPLLAFDSSKYKKRKEI